ncbi:MAG: amidohydrolase family protein, partial [Mycolicibacterium sp.]|nr:amidohydrolase family protein [Mycolicibacterium sp.]
EMETDLEEVVRILAVNKWPWRLHATYDETISRALDTFERVNQDIPIGGLHWLFDHAETISDRSIDRIAALGGGIAVQHRMAYQGEYFVERYGIGAAEATPPIARMLEAGLPVSAGTDATRWPPTIRGSRCRGSSPAKPWVACASTRPAIASTARQHSGCGPKRSLGSRMRRAKRVGSRSVSSPIWSCPTATTSPVPRMRLPTLWPR